MKLSHFPTSQWQLPPIYRPTLSPEHGVYVVLLISLVTGAAAAQQWTWMTTLALICAFCSFQAEHPLVLQIKQRKTWKPRFLLWGGVYGSIALAIALALVWVQGIDLIWIYLGAIAALVVDLVSVWHRQQKSIANELITFAGVCLAAPLAYLATTGAIANPIIGLWLLDTLFFSSTIFTVKLRKKPPISSLNAVIYHLIATLIIIGLYYLGWLSLVTATAWGVALLKFSSILVGQNWYRQAPIKYVALLETCSALLFLVIVAISLLPAYLAT
ncbi:YwiC-like family protein [Merismopedia glauca]|uniref:YwiC-like family protein n=1 Tax=Merismopedia glauca CCAP 1448/3 TaxID=1296344 RepID=A0A2T1C1S3_9CYAN|nr:YwiC-like family protein [Merismopedia glauca]PSB02226.1 hypothetical protein C7B64_14210 [Merismopedia glauca CCAP 1448/3]